MGEPIKNNVFGIGGVNIVKKPIEMALDEATQLQNAEILMDEGQTALRQRGGLAALNGSAMSGSVLGGTGWPLKTTYTRTLYAALGTADANTWKTSTNGTSWSDTSTPAAAAQDSKYGDENNVLDARRMVAFRTFLLYPGNGYTQDTDDPIVVLWDGTASVTVVSIRPGPSSTGGVPAFVITDMLVANGKLYIALHEPGGTAPDNAGRVVELSLDTGKVQQIATAFGDSATVPEVTGGAPSALAFYKGQLFVGLNHQNTTDGVGKIVRCFPGFDTTWTTDVSNLTGSVSSLCVYKGKLYAGTQSSASAAEKVYERSPTAGTWAASFTGVGAGGAGHVGHLIVYGGNLYGAQYHSTAPTIHIKKFDGSSWTTDRDVDSSDSGVAGNLPGGSVLGANSDLFFTFRATAAGNNDGFILRLASGSWTKVSTDNYLGPIALQVTRTA